MLNTSQLNKLTHVRKTFHAHPEISEQEFETQKRILSFLTEESTARIEKTGVTGVLATFDSNQAGPTILIRGDIDALPITEINTFDYKSIYEGVSHKCGHDGHTTILLGLAQLLSEQPITNGKVVLLFQPAEENGKGAEAVLNDNIFNNLKIDYVFALHNLPGFPLHELVIKENVFTSNVKSIIIKLHGKTAHAAEPEKGHNPANAISHILQYASEKTNNVPASEDFFLITPIHIKMGDTAYGISAGYGEVHFTIRSWSNELMKSNCIELENYIAKLCKKEHLTFETSWLEEFYSNNNDITAVNFIRAAAKKNNFSTSEISTPFKWGEDFGLFTQRFKGAMFGLGAGEKTPALHNPDYDFPDEITPTGVNIFYAIINETLEV